MCVCVCMHRHRFCMPWADWRKRAAAGTSGDASSIVLHTSAVAGMPEFGSRGSIPGTLRIQLLQLCWGLNSMRHSAVMGTRLGTVLCMGAALDQCWVVYHVQRWVWEQGLVPSRGQGGD